MAVCDAIVSICCPYRTLELGVQHLISLVNRDIYPENEYPYGQWDYSEKPLPKLDTDQACSIST